MSEGEAFWEARYARSSPKSSGRPSAVLVRFVEGLPPGRSLDLGCARGDDVVWLARQGWTATGVDVSETALEYARANAAAAGVAGAFARHDLATSFPSGRFELVTALFLQSPVAFPRAEVLARAARAVAPGGLLLSVSHGSAAPWSWGDPDRSFPSAEEELAALGLEPEAWERVFVGSTERTAQGPGGQTAVLLDTIVAVRRRAAEGAG